ncbi:MAG: 5'-methylthioadenosine/S-adenosylhomocysteine nucleosidase [Anaerolineales bacterium]
MRMLRIFLTGLLSGLMVALIGCTSTPEISAAKTDDVPRIAVMSAYEPELKILLDKAQISDIYVINGRSYHVGQLAGNQVVLCLSGVSMVNAAMTTQTVLDHFQVDGIVFSGIAGGVNPELKIGDVVVPDQWGQYQEQLFARENGDGWDLGRYSEEFPNYGMMFPQNVSVTRKHNKADSQQELFWFQVDPKMYAVAEQVAGKVQLDPCPLVGKCLQTDPGVIVGGNGVSGPTFVDNAQYRDWVWDTFQANALDMESAAVAHVAYVNDVPFIAFRSLSDLAGGGSGENEIGIFFQLASDNSAKVVIAFLEAWSGR